MKTFITTIVFLIVSLVTFSQGPKVVVEKNEVLVGEQFYIYYRLPVSISDSINYSPFKTEIPSYILEGKKDTNFVDVEIVQPFKDSIFHSNGMSEWVGKYKVTVWDSGEVNLPKISLLKNDSLVEFSSIKVNVSLAKHIEGKDIYDIKEGFTDLPDALKDVKSFLKKHWWWIVLSLIVIVAAILIFIKKRKKAKLAGVLSLEELALSKIEELNKKKLWLDNKLKQHYIELSYILRDYLSNKLVISLLEKTTDEATLLLKQKSLPQDKIDAISEILLKSDMVKFAKSAPEEYEILKTSSLTIEIIKEVQNLVSDVE